MSFSSLCKGQKGPEWTINCTGHVSIFTCFWRVVYLWCFFVEESFTLQQSVLHWGHLRA